MRYNNIYVNNDKSMITNERGENIVDIVMVNTTEGHVRAKALFDTELASRIIRGLRMVEEFDRNVDDAVGAGVQRRLSKQL